MNDKRTHPPSDAPQTSSESGTGRRPGHVPLEAVLFDLFHTLVDMRHVPQMSSTADILGIDPRDWSRVIVESSPHHALGSIKDPVESIRIVAHAIDPSIPAERIREAARLRPERFRMALVSVQPEILDAIERIHAAGLKLALISNAGLDEITAWDESPLAPYFSATLFSCHEGLMKPDVAIYHRAAQQLGVAPENCLFIGDGGSQEHKGAGAAGMRTVLFLPMLAYSYPDIAARRPRNTDWVIETAPDLAALIGRLREEGLPAA